MGMTRKDYKMVAAALKVVGIEEQRVWSTDDPGAGWWRTLNELSSRLAEDNPRFNEAIFRAAAIPTQEDSE